MLKALRRTRGRTKERLKHRAARVRERLIAANRHHAEDDLPRSNTSARKIWDRMSPKSRANFQKAMSLPEGRKALRRYRSFTGLPLPPEVKVIELPGPKNKAVVLTGMGRSPEVQLADGSERSVGRVKQFKGKRYAATDADGKRIYILSGRSSKDSSAKLRYAGHAPETHYVLTRGEENAGTFKKGKYWIHSHDDEGGRWPKVYKDQAGNFVYAPGTYRVGKWIRRN